MKPFPKLFKAAVVATSVVVLATAPVAAAHSGLGCQVPVSLEPLFNLLDTFTKIAFLAGVSLGTLGFTFSGLMIAAPLGEEGNRQGKTVAKHVLLGTIILLSANMVMSFLVNELGGVVCG